MPWRLCPAVCPLVSMCLCVCFSAIIIPFVCEFSEHLNRTLTLKRLGLRQFAAYIMIRVDLYPCMICPYISVCLSILQSVGLFASVSPSVFLSICLCLSVSDCVCSTISPSVCLSVYLSFQFNQHFHMELLLICSIGQEATGRELCRFGHKQKSFQLSRESAEGEQQRIFRRRIELFQFKLLMQCIGFSTNLEFSKHSSL